MKHHILAIHAIPEGTSEDAVKEILGRIAAHAHDRGWQPIETFYALEAGRAYTYGEADTLDRVRETYEAAGIEGVDVLDAQRIFTELLHRPRRSR